MSLNWSVENCKNWKTLCNKKGSENGEDILEWKITESLVWSSITCGFGEITKKNYEEIWFRVNLWETYRGTYINQCDNNGNSSPYYITIKDVKNRIGLHTNADRQTTRQNFSRLIKSVKENSFEHAEGLRYRSSK